jgi:hypothetical protein
MQKTVVFGLISVFAGFVAVEHHQERDLPELTPTQIKLPTPDELLEKAEFTKKADSLDSLITINEKNLKEKIKNKIIDSVVVDTIRFDTIKNKK